MQLLVNSPRKQGRTPLQHCFWLFLVVWRLWRVRTLEAMSNTHRGLLGSSLVGTEPSPVSALSIDELRASGFCTHANSANVSGLLGWCEYDRASIPPTAWQQHSASKPWWCCPDGLVGDESKDNACALKSQLLSVTGRVSYDPRTLNFSITPRYTLDHINKIFPDWKAQHTKGPGRWWRVLLPGTRDPGNLRPLRMMLKCSLARGWHEQRPIS